jgi:hypothetical protein
LLVYSMIQSVKPADSRSEFTDHNAVGAGGSVVLELLVAVLTGSADVEAEIDDADDEALVHGCSL